MQEHLCLCFNVCIPRCTVSTPGHTASCHTPLTASFLIPPQFLILSHFSSSLHCCTHSQVPRFCGCAQPQPAAAPRCTCSSRPGGCRGGRWPAPSEYLHTFKPLTLNQALSTQVTHVYTMHFHPHKEVAIHCFKHEQLLRPSPVVWNRPSRYYLLWKYLQTLANCTHNAPFRCWRPS